MIEEKDTTKMIMDEAFHTKLEYPWKRCYFALMRLSEKEEMISEDYRFSLHLEGEVRRHWDTIKHQTLLDPFRLGKLLDILYMTKDIEGDIVECGSFKGGSGILMAIILKQLNIKKHIHLFDSFEGLPDPDKEHDKGYKRGQFKSNYLELQTKIEELNLTENVTLHKGWFSATVPSFLTQSISKISLLHIDCDLYSSTMDCFPQLYPFVTTNGAIVLDDFNDGGRGEKKAIVQTLRQYEETETIIASPAPQSYFIKNASNTSFKVQEQNVKYNVSELMENSDYLRWLKNSIEEEYTI